MEGIIYEEKTCNFGYSKAKANSRISKRHNSSHCGEPPNLIKIWNLRKNYFNNSKTQHEWIAWNMTWIFSPTTMKAIWPFNRPAKHQITNPQSKLKSTKFRFLLLTNWFFKIKHVYFSFFIMILSYFLSLSLS